MATVIREEKRIMTDCVEANHNKFWTGQLLDNGTVITLWGRVGDKGQSKEFPGAGASFLEQKLREKERKGYRVIDSVNAVSVTSSGVNKKITNGNLRDIAHKQIKVNNPIVAKLLDRLVKENAHTITTATGGNIVYNDVTGLFTTATGDVVSQRTIDEANLVLEDIANMVANKDYGIDLGKRTNDYLMLITSNIGHKKLDVREFWQDLSKVQAQKQIIDALQASLLSASSLTVNDKKTPKTSEEKVFDCQLDLVEDRNIIDKLRKIYNNTRKNMHACHHLDVKSVYEVNINTVRSAFERDGANMNNQWDLWHGTRVSNLLSIIRSGLVIPPSTSPHVCGRAFGDGLYFSDQSTKSLNYAYGYWSGGARDNNCFMFMCKVAMGRYYEPRNTFKGKCPSGYDSTFAKGGGVFQNNEMIVYRTGQCDLRYLIEFSPHGK